MAREDEDFIKQVTQTVFFDAVRELADEADTKMAKWARENLSNSLRSSTFRGELSKMHEELGELAREEMLKAYKKGKKRGRKSYRKSDTGKLKRYSNKQMEKGLNSDGLIVTDHTGIDFNFSEIYKYAKQWARLNFGTEGEDGGSVNVRDEKIKIFRRSLQDSPSLSSIGARKGFIVPSSISAYAVSSGKAYDQTPSPASIIRTTRQNKYLYVYGNSGRGLGKRKFRNKRSEGIRGWRFLDQGLNAMNKEYGPSLTKLLEARSKEFDKKPPSKQNVKIKPRAQRRRR